MAKQKKIERPDGRALDELRKVQMKKNLAPAAAGSVLISMGNTQVICGVTIEEGVPGWMRGQENPGGWVTAEYRMLPYSVENRARRETGKVGGRTQEIQRLIGRSLRAAVDMQKLGPRTIWIDCDVLQADGGTRTASITGGFLAMRLAIDGLMKSGAILEDPVIEEIAAVSVGIVDGRPVLDLPYVEDAAAETDMNVVMTASGKFIEIQGTAEEAPFSRRELNALLKLSEKGIGELVEMQRKARGKKR